MAGSWVRRWIASTSALSAACTASTAASSGDVTAAASPSRLRGGRMVRPEAVRAPPSRSAAAAGCTAGGAAAGGNGAPALPLWLLLHLPLFLHQVLAAAHRRLQRLLHLAVAVHAGAAGLAAPPLPPWCCA